MDKLSDLIGLVVAIIIGCLIFVYAISIPKKHNCNSDDTDTIIIIGAVA